MSDKALNFRQKLVLLHCELGKSYALSQIAALMRNYTHKAYSAATLRRDLSLLTDLRILKQSGSKKATKYSLNPKQLLLCPIDSHEYCQIDIDNRTGNRQFNFDLLGNVPKRGLLDKAEIAALKGATKKYQEASTGTSETVRKKELERFVIELSWKSSKIEGNTYSLLDTELLLKEGVEASGHSREEATMILNHKRAFDYILKTKDEFLKLGLSHIADVHRLLVQDLNITFGLRNRVIGITGSLYRPLTFNTQIKEACQSLILATKNFKEPFSKALLMLAGLAYIQPFEDGNKRTARLTANAVLLAQKCAPLSYRSVSEKTYREAMLTFYEKNSIVSLKKVFIEQYIFACENYLQF